MLQAPVALVTSNMPDATSAMINQPPEINPDHHAHAVASAGKTRMKRSKTPTFLVVIMRVRNISRSLLDQAACLRAKAARLSMPCP
jgi:hypothetical protein